MRAPPPAPALALALALALVATGCLRVGPGEDLHLVCERESTSPWHPYSPADLEVVTRIEGPPTTPEQRGRLLTEAADRLLTQGAAPYETFEARLAHLGGGVWLFAANGTAGGATDAYAIELPALNATVFAPTILLTRAHEIAVAGGAVDARPDAVERATWTPELAGCVRLDYAGGGTVWANVDKGQVVAQAS